MKNDSATGSAAKAAPAALWPALLLIALVLSACSSLLPPRSQSPSSTPAAPLPISQSGNEVAIYALDLIGTGYRFGGKNPEAGLDCSGMVSYIYREAAGIKISGSAADIAKRGKEIDRQSLRPGDLIFFNTEHKPFSHVAIYIGDNRFVHAPSTNGRVRIDRLDNRYYAERYEMARSYFD